MDYEFKFNIVKNSLIQCCKTLVSENHDDAFSSWLLMEADMEFGYAYQHSFREQFGAHITEDVEAQLWFAGKQIVYIIYTLLAIRGEDCDIAEILEFTEAFIQQQLGDFETDYDTMEWS